MRNYNADTYNVYKKSAQLHANRSTPTQMEFYLPWVIDLAHKFGTDDKQSGILDIHDLISAGNEGLVRAWNNLDWDKIKTIVKEEQQPYIWSQLKIKINSYIRREIENCSEEIKTPRRMIEESRLDKSDPLNYYTKTFDIFFEGFDIAEEITPWDNEMLYEFLHDLLSKHVPNTAHKTILMSSFGMDTMDDKPVSEKKLAEMYKLSPGYVRLAKHRTIQALKDNPEVMEKIKLFLEN